MDSLATNMLDFEEELERFTVRTGKTQTEEKASTSRNYKNEVDLIPLLIKDIHQLILPDRSFAETITAYGFAFASALIYGRISTTGASANGKLRYCLDDGTGMIKCYRTFGANKELYQSVQNIIKTTRKQMLDVGSLPYGTKVLLIGRPHRLFEDIAFSVFEMIVDTGLNRDLELSVKNFIIDWYANRFKGRPLKGCSTSHIN